MARAAGKGRAEPRGVVRTMSARKPRTQTLEIGLGGVGVLPDRMRKLRPEVVAALAESIAAIGQGEPIIVRPREGGGYWLVAGLHRLQACRKLKRETIRAEVQDVDEDTARLIEIDENLVRADLTPAERAEHVGRRKELYERLHPKTKQGGAPGKAGGGKKAQDPKMRSFVDHTAAITGKGRATVARDATRAKTIVVLGDIVDTSLDRGDELDALTKLAPDEQRQLAARAQAGERVSAKARVKQLARAERERVLGAKQLALPTKEYGVMVRRRVRRRSVVTRDRHGSPRKQPLRDRERRPHCRPDARAHQGPVQVRRQELLAGDVVDRSAPGRRD